MSTLNRLITKNPIFPLFFASIIAYLQGPFVAMWPGWAKLILALGIYVSLFCIPYFYIRRNKLDFTKLVFACYCILFLMVGISLYNGLAFPKFNAGNKYITLFFNQTCLPLLFPPFFAFCATVGNVQRLLKCSKWIIYILIIYTLFIVGFGLSNCVLWIGVFYPFFSKRNKCFFIVALLAVLYIGIVGIAGTRKYLILLFFVLLYITMNAFNLKDKLYRCLGIILLCGVFFFAFNMIRSIDNQDEPFLGMLMSNIDSDKISKGDTRTFLYIETITDLIQTNTLWLGKGVYSYIYSPYFEFSGADSSKRLSIEVPFLMMMQRAGIIYTFIYLLIILLGIRNSLFHSNNCFLRTVAIMQIGYLFLFFIGDVSGCSFFHLGFWVLTGCTLSKKWLYMTDHEIKNIGFNGKRNKSLNYSTNL